MGALRVPVSRARGQRVRGWRRADAVYAGSAWTRDRSLEQLYGPDHELKRSNRVEGGAVVTMTIPYRVVPRDVQEEKEWIKSAP